MRPSAPSAIAAPPEPAAETACQHCPLRPLKLFIEPTGDELALVQSLKDAGHVVEVLPEAFSDTMGRAGALVRHPNGVIEGAADPRSDGSVAAV